MKLSVIIPVYNVENYLSKCIESVLCPELEDYEIITVNDGSTDSSPEICAEYAARYPGIVVNVNKENGGLGSARNAGIEAARGEYLLFLDSDDYICENGIKEIYSCLAEDFDIAIFDFVTVDESGRQMLYTKGSGRQGTFSFDEYPELLHYPPNACNKIWKRELFADNGVAFPPRVWFEDLHTCPKLYLHAEKMLYFPKGWYNYLQRKGSITNTKNPARNLEIIGAVDSVCDYYKEKGVFEKYRDELEYMALYHQFITSCFRVNLADKKSSVQDMLQDDFTKKFPEYRKNPYIRKMPAKLKLILFMLEHKMYGAYNLMMTLNNKVKGK